MAETDYGFGAPSIVNLGIAFSLLPNTDALYTLGSSSLGWLGLTLHGGTVTVNTLLINATQTWNNAAVAFTGMTLNVTDTASAAASLFMQYQVGGVSQFSVRKDGRLSLIAGAFNPTLIGGGSPLLQLHNTQILISATDGRFLDIVPAAANTRNSVRQFPLGAPVDGVKSTFQVSGTDYTAIGTGAEYAEFTFENIGSGPTGTTGLQTHVNSFATGIGIPRPFSLRVSGWPILWFPNPGAGVTITNLLQVQGAVTGGSPSLLAFGTDANIAFTLGGKGTSNVVIVGGTGSGLTLPADPTTALQAATKQYVDAATGNVALNAVTTTVDVVNTVTETDLYNFTVPANTISTSKALRFKMIGDQLKNDGGAGQQWTVRVYFGATNILTFTRTPATNSASRQLFDIDVMLMAKGATNSQVASGKVISSTGQSPNTSLVDTNGDPGYLGAYSYNNAIAVDSTAGQAFRVSVQWGTANASLSARLLSARLELIK